MNISEINEKHIIIEFRLTRNKLLAMFTALFVMWFPKMIDSEELKLTTYYPAPYGGYARLLTTNMTLLAKDAGNVGIGNTTAPAEKLEVKSGNVQVTAGNVTVSAGNISVPSGNVVIGSPLGTQPSASGWLRAEGLQGMCKKVNYTNASGGPPPTTTNNPCGTDYVSMGYAEITSLTTRLVIFKTGNGADQFDGIRVINNITGKMLCCKIKD